jgi:hypothetical protein
VGGAFALRTGFFALDQIAPDHPEWKSHKPFKAVLANDLPALAHSATSFLLNLNIFRSPGQPSDAKCCRKLKMRVTPLPVELDGFLKSGCY